MKTPQRAQLYAYWYFCIAGGFTLLAINRWMVGEKIWLVLLRLAIAAGFVVLGIITRG